jgi:hypothetical protein
MVSIIVYQRTSFTVYTRQIQPTADGLIDRVRGKEICRELVQCFPHPLFLAFYA